MGKVHESDAIRFARTPTKAKPKPKIVDDVDDGRGEGIGPNAGSFLCLCPPRSFDRCDAGSGVDSPEPSLGEIRHVLQGVNFRGCRGADAAKDDDDSDNDNDNDGSRVVICLKGGGVAAEGNGCRPELALVGGTLAVLSGSLDNYAYLVRKFFVDELGLPRNVSLEAIRQSTPIRDAAVLARLYERLGSGMLPKLRGRFAICVYDSAAGKALAARDPSGAVSLVQGSTKDGRPFIASGGAVPAGGAVNVVEIRPGKYKFGWQSRPKRYANPVAVVEAGASVAAMAAAAALTGIVVKEKRSNPTIASRKRNGKSDGSGCSGDEGRWVEEEFEDGCCRPSEVPRFRTRREIREWTAAVAREAIESYEKAAAAEEEDGVDEGGEEEDVGDTNPSSRHILTVADGSAPNGVSIAGNGNIATAQRRMKKGDGHRSPSSASASSCCSSSSAFRMPAGSSRSPTSFASRSSAGSTSKSRSSLGSLSPSPASETGGSFKEGDGAGSNRQTASPVRYSPWYGEGSVDGVGSSEGEWSSSMTRVSLNGLGVGSQSSREKGMGGGLSNSRSCSSFSSSNGSAGTRE